MSVNPSLYEKLRTVIVSSIYQHVSKLKEAEVEVATYAVQIDECYDCFMVEGFANRTSDIKAQHDSREYLKEKFSLMEWADSGVPSGDWDEVYSVIAEVNQVYEEEYSEEADAYQIAKEAQEKADREAGKPITFATSSRDVFAPCEWAHTERLHRTLYEALVEVREKGYFENSVFLMIWGGDCEDFITKEELRGLNAGLSADMESYYKYIGS